MLLCLEMLAALDAHHDFVNVLLVEMAEWGDRFTGQRKPEVSDRSGLGPLTAQPVRTCKNGEPVDAIEAEVGDGKIKVDPMSTMPSGQMSINPAGRRFMRGGTSPGLRDIGAPGPDERAH